VSHSREDPEDPPAGELDSELTVTDNQPLEKSSHRARALESLWLKWFDD
jgi:hypothetical protein